MKKITRREALRILSATGIVATFPQSLAFAGETASAIISAAQSPIPHLAAITGPDPKTNLRTAIQVMGGIGKYIKKREKVVIKPNLGFGNPAEEATTTDPRVIRAMAELCLEAGASRVSVLDHPCHNEDIVLDVCGVKTALEGLKNVYLYTVTNEKFYKEVKIPKGKSLTEAMVARDILEADAIINLPTSKSHGSAKVTFGMKNWMGVVYNRKSWHVWHNLHQAIADMAGFMKPRLTVLDATRTLVTGGPGGPGDIKHTRTIIAGVDPVAVDAFALTLAPFGGKGYKPSEIPSIQAAYDAGLGEIDINKLNIYRKTA